MPENSSGKESGKIAVIGPTQSGKTCLAVGLYSMNVRGFTVEPVEGSSYLNDRKVEFAGGGWPAPTAVGTKKDIRLDFSTKGKDPIRVSFPDFAGEVLRFDEPESGKKFEAFANEHFSGLSGVVLLINPGAEVFQKGDPRLLADGMSQYKRVLAFLRDENNHSNKAFVALTVTAADRIKGDLQGKLETFDQSVEEISNTLNSSGFTWKRFDVTVTGHLKDQNSPRLAKGRKNSASAPFLWILDELEDGKAYPKASDASEVKVRKGGIVNLLVLDMDAYAEKYGNKSVRKNISIPAFMDTFIERNRMSLSKITQDAIADIMSQ